MPCKNLKSWNAAVIKLCRHFIGGGGKWMSNYFINTSYRSNGNVLQCSNKQFNSVIWFTSGALMTKMLNIFVMWSIPELSDLCPRWWRTVLNKCNSNTTGLSVYKLSSRFLEKKALYKKFVCMLSSTNEMFSIVMVVVVLLIIILSKSC